MKIIHRVSMSVDEVRQRAFQSVGVELKSGGFDGFEIPEDDARWPQVAQLVKRFGTLDVVSVAYSAAERAAAAYLRLAPAWHHGYPQPEADFGYRQLTYDLSHYCQACGQGLQQKAPFRMKKAPVWGQRSILQLNWVFDQYFVTPQAWAQVFAPFGIEKRAVVLHKTGAEIDSVVQLQFNASVDVEVTGLDVEVCPVCGTHKYQSASRGFQPTPTAPPAAAMVRSNQWFGSGASAFQAVIISQALYQAISDAKLKGAEFLPCGDQAAS